ncbi:hypothetical protein [Rhizobium leguminosarum]|uniref:hypothetical protein n=1 Tax=Rhizobium leguminosarum TaxID=384 RepID=UPI00103BB658|nr:hypothetical protein [Rhizobium leguminosarum]TBY17452.1 hypothetical protein E0H30_25865 [Rhizobium leguminosarum bv. viciae]TBY24658.1 hypothetical protein E0H37_23355 [Rhizobium leguminosarum bv. viciae]TBY99678.1 hypothetical protein E0H49_17325 [Rhizobium leguminosarum bv. viciae]TCA52807.1 hypothetical protein E0H71_16175 [Rhizobium leguminosarum bv. viciae]TCA70385.1 hypothetical protein E0H69_25110 [Rhizobium leguminosarum bv. viciae]
MSKFNEADIRNAAFEEAARLIEEGFDRPGIAKKQDTCAHGKFGWEDCESCAAAAIRALKSDPAPVPAPNPSLFRIQPVR